MGLGGDGSPRARRARQRFDRLSREADEAGVAWRDLVGEAYGAPGDRRVGGITVHVDWTWRADEIERRLRLRRVPPGPDGPHAGEVGGD